ncbi:hypothetical protein ACIQYL_10020 [Lysinibacillus xylanilyticus]|uniref:hypothetical protein n=1 Tax=Lysinibacillus xylanilyticus TaxID=582475 RepID=UPI00382B6514
MIYYKVYEGNRIIDEYQILEVNPKLGILNPGDKLLINGEERIISTTSATSEGDDTYLTLYLAEKIVDLI